MKKPIFTLGLGVAITLVGCLTSTEEDDSSNSEAVVSSEGESSSESLNTDSLKQEAVDSLDLDNIGELDSLISSTINLSSFSEICTAEKADWDLAIEVTQDCINSGTNLKVVEQTTEVEVKKEVILVDEIFLCQQEADNEALAENAYLGCLAGEVNLSSLVEMSSSSTDSTDVMEPACLTEMLSVDVATENYANCIEPAINEEMPIEPVVKEKTPIEQVIKEEIIVDPIPLCLNESAELSAAQSRLDACESPVLIKR